MVSPVLCRVVGWAVTLASVATTNTKLSQGERPDCPRFRANRSSMTPSLEVAMVRKAEVTLAKEGSIEIWGC